MLEQNQILQGRYQILRPLGHGGMGTVYEARDKKLFGKLVALKEILLDKTLIPHQQDHRIVRRAFEREAKILTQLGHEAFPQVIDYFVENECQFLVMELIQGKDLSELLKKRKTPFEWEDVSLWANQLLDALDYLHTLDPPTIHRDIKPQNLKLTSRKRLKLLDFGIAKGAEFPTNITFSNQTFIAATFNYSPFEQVYRVLDSSFKEALMPFYGKQLNEIANQTADTRSDIYALGATLYHLLTKQLPFDSLKRTLEHWVGNQDPLPSPQTLNPKLSDEVSNWVLKAMEVDREQRFESAAAMKRALQLFTQDNKIHEESTRKLKWQREQALLRFERERLAEERRLFEEERRHFIEITQEPLSEAVTIRDLLDEKVNGFKTNGSIHHDLFSQPSQVTIIAEKPEKEIRAVESPTDFTATSYLVNYELASKNGKTEISSEETPKTILSPTEQRKPAKHYPTGLIALLLLGGTVFGGLVFQNSFNKPENSKQVNESVISNQNANVSNQSTPESTPNVLSETQVQNPANEALTNPNPDSTPKPFSSQSKPKQVTQPTKETAPIPKTPQIVRTLPAKPVKTPKPKNLDCIFNNDCR